MLLGRIAARRSATLSARARQLTPEASLKERSRTKDEYGVAGACPQLDCYCRTGPGRVACDRVRQRHPLRRAHAAYGDVGTRRPGAAVVADAHGVQHGD